MAKAKQLILVMVQGGCVQDVTHSADQGWDVWDCDDFEDDPLSYWEVRDDETRAHIREHWPTLYAEILETVEKAQHEAAIEALEESRKAEAVQAMN
jgi:hypothetical protein